MDVNNIYSLSFTTDHYGNGSAVVIAKNASEAETVLKTHGTLNATPDEYKALTSRVVGLSSIDEPALITEILGGYTLIKGPKGTNEYSEITNKPTINGVTVNGALTSETLLLPFIDGDGNYSARLRNAYNEADGNYSVVEGSGNSALEARAHVEGYKTVANKSSAHVEGRGNSALSEGSHVEGGIETNKKGTVTLTTIEVPAVLATAIIDNDTYTESDTVEEDPSYQYYYKDHGTQEEYVILSKNYTNLHTYYLDQGGNIVEDSQVSCTSRTGRTDAYTAVKQTTNIELFQGLAFGTHVVKSYDSSTKIVVFNDNAAVIEQIEEEGDLTTFVGSAATGVAAHAEGINTAAQGIASHTEGKGTTAQNLGESANGCYNVSHKASGNYGVDGNSQFTVGVGTSSANRSNAIEITQAGKVYIKNIGGYNGSTIGSSTLDLVGALSALEGRIFIAKYYPSGTGTSTTFSEIVTAFNAGKVVVMFDTNTNTFGFLTRMFSNSCNFTCVAGNSSKIYAVSEALSWTVSETTLQDTSYKVTSLTSSSTDVEYPSAKCVYDRIGEFTTNYATYYGMAGEGYSGVSTAYFKGNRVYCIYNSLEIPLTLMEQDGATFTGTDGTNIYKCYLSNENVWSSTVTPCESTSNKKTSLSVSGNISDTYYPSTQAVKTYVDTQVASAGANYLTSSASGEPFATHAALTAATVFYSGGVTVTPASNDYTMVTVDEDHDSKTSRYIYDGTNWAWQYSISTTFSAAQQAALDSGITAAAVSTMESTANRVNTITGNESATNKYPSTKAVADAIAAKKDTLWADSSTTLSAVTSAHSEGRPVCRKIDNVIYSLVYIDSTKATFYGAKYDTAKGSYITLTSSGWASSTTDVLFALDGDVLKKTGGTITGELTLNDDLNVDGHTTLMDGLSVADGDVSITDNLSIYGASNTTGNATFGANINISSFSKIIANTSTTLSDALAAKANKVSNATNGNLAKLDTNGDLADSGISSSTLSSILSHLHLDADSHLYSDVDFYSTGTVSAGGYSSGGGGGGTTGITLKDYTYIKGMTAATTNEAPTAYAMHEFYADFIGRTINGKALSSNITLSASDVGAFSSSDIIPAANLPANVVYSATLDGYVKTTDAQTIGGVKTFSDGIAVPFNKLTDASTTTGISLYTQLLGKVNTTGDESISGEKTFNGKIKLNVDNLATLVYTGSGWGWIKTDNGSTSLISTLETKADKVAPETEHNIATLSSTGNLEDSQITKASLSNLLSWFKLDASGHLYTDLDFYSTGTVSAGGYSSGGGGGSSSISLKELSYIEDMTAATSNEAPTAWAAHQIDAKLGDCTSSNTAADKSYVTSALASKAGTSVATTSANGLMSSADKTKLNGIATNATYVTKSTVSGWGFTEGAVTTIKLNSNNYTPSSGVVDLGTVVTDISGKADANNVVNLSDAQTNIGGAKTFTSGIIIEANAILKAKTSGWGWLSTDNGSTSLATTLSGKANTSGTYSDLSVGSASLAEQAASLQTSRTLWGQSFNGSANVSGNMSNVGSITATGDISTTGGLDIDGTATFGGYIDTEGWDNIRWVQPGGTSSTLGDVIGNLVSKVTPKVQRTNESEEDVISSPTTSTGVIKHIKLISSGETHTDSNTLYIVI